METNNKSGYTIICKSLYHTSKYDSNSLYELKLEKNNSIIIDVDWKIKNPYSCLNVELKEKGFFFLSIKEKAISSGQIDKYKDNSGKLSFIITAEAFISSEKVATKQIEIIFDNGKKRKAIACVLALCIGIPVAGGIAAGIAVPLVNKNKGGDEPKPEPTPTPIEIDLKGATTASIEYGNTVKEQYTCTYKDKEGKEVSAETKWSVVDKTNLPVGVSAKINESGLLTLDATTYDVVRTGNFVVTITAINKENASLSKSIDLTITVTGDITPSKDKTIITPPSSPIDVVAGGTSGSGIGIDFRNKDNKKIPTDEIDVTWIIDDTSKQALEDKDINVSINPDTGYVTIDATDYGDATDVDFTQPGVKVILETNTSPKITWDEIYVPVIITGDTIPKDATITPPTIIEAIAGGTTTSTDPFTVKYQNQAGKDIPDSKVSTTWSIVDTTLPSSVTYSIDPSSGVLTLDASNCHDVTDGTYQITVQVSDNKGFTKTQNVNVTLKGDVVPAYAIVSGTQSLEITAGDTTSLEQEYNVKYQNAGQIDIPSTVAIPTRWTVSSVEPEITNLDIKFDSSTKNKMIVDASQCVLASDQTVTIKVTAETTTEPIIKSEDYSISLKVNRTPDVPASAKISGDEELVVEAGSKTLIYSNPYQCVFKNAAQVEIPSATANYYFDADQKTTTKTLDDGTVLTITNDHKIQIDASASRLTTDTPYTVNLTAVSTQKETVSDNMNVKVTVNKVDLTPTRAVISGQEAITTYAGNQTNVEETYSVKFYNKDDVEITPTTINWTLLSSATPITGVTVGFDSVNKNKLVINSSASRITSQDTTTIQIKATDPVSSISDTFDINLTVNQMDDVPSTVRISGDSWLNIDAGQPTKVTTNPYSSVVKNKDGIVLDNEQVTYTITDKTALPSEVTADIVNGNQIQIDASQSRVTTETTYTIEITVTSNTISTVSDKMTLNIIVAPLSTVVTSAQVEGMSRMDTVCGATLPMQEQYTVKYFNNYGIQIGNNGTTWSVESVTPAFASGVTADFSSSSSSDAIYSVDTRACRETSDQACIVKIKATDNDTNVSGTIDVTVNIGKFDNVPTQAQIDGDTLVTVDAKSTTPSYTHEYTCVVTNAEGIEIPEANVTYSFNRDDSSQTTKTFDDGTVITLESDNRVKVDASASIATVEVNHYTDVVAFVTGTNLKSSVQLHVKINGSQQQQPTSIDVTGDDVIPVLSGSTSTSPVYKYVVRDADGNEIPDSPVSWEFDKGILPSGVSISKTEDNKISVDASGYTVASGYESFAITLTIKSNVVTTVQTTKTIYISITSSSYLPASATINGATTITVAGNRTSSAATYTATYKNASGTTIDPGFSTGTSWSIESQSFTDTGVVARIDETTGQLKIDASNATSREAKSTGTVVVRGTSTFAPSVYATSAEINIKVNPQVDGNYITYGGETYKMVDNIDINTYTFGNTMGANITVPLATGDVTINRTTVTDLVIQTIDSSVQSVPNNFAYGCSSLESVDLSGLGGLKTIGYSFMSGCSSLTDIDLSYLNGVTSIDYNFLVNCSSLSNIDLGFMSEVESVGSQFLMGCSSLVSLDLSPLGKVKTIGNQFLSECSGLTYLDCSPLVSIQSIGNRFLNYCNNLTKVNMGSITANIISDDVKMSSYYSFCCHYKTSVPCVTGLTLVGDDADAIREKFPERTTTESGWYRIWA